MRLGSHIEDNWHHRTQVSADGGRRSIRAGAFMTLYRVLSDEMVTIAAKVPIRSLGHKAPGRHPELSSTNSCGLRLTGMLDGGGAILMRISVNRSSVYDVDFERLRLVGCLPNPLTYARFHNHTRLIPIDADRAEAYLGPQDTPP